MAINLFGDPYNLQGSSGASLQGGANPQQASSIYGPSPLPAPVAPVKPARPTRPRIAAPAAPTAQPKPLNSIFEPYIGTRPSPYNPGVLEYFRKDTNQGLSQQDLFNFASQLGAGAINSLEQLHAPVGGFNQQVQNYQPVVDPGQTLAQNAGTAGLSPDEYTKIIQQQNQLTPEEITQIRGGLGIDQLENVVFTPPAQTTEQLYNDAYSSAGLADVKQKILDLNKLVNDKRQQFVDAQGNINENPFLSESSRVGRISRLQDKAQLEINNILDQQKQYQDLYQQGLNEVNGLVTRHTNDFTTEQTLNTQKLQYLLSKAEQQAAATVAQKNQKAYSYLPDYLKAKAKATAPTTFSAGNGASFYFDKTTGTFQQLTDPLGQYTSATDLAGNPVAFNTRTGQYGSSGGAFSGSVSIPQNTLAFRNNNPGNLRFAGQPGATQGEGGFARFSSPEAGYQALIAQIQLDAGRGATLSQFINKYAPPSENNTSLYIQQAIAATGASANTPISQIDLNTLAQFMAKKESSTTVNGSYQAGGQSAQGNSILDPFIRKTATGASYIDIDKVGSKQKDAVQLYAGQAGIPILSAQESGKLNNIEVSRSNLQNIEGTVNSFLASGPAERLITGPRNKLEEALQTNPNISAFKSYRTAIINNVQALAGGEGSGLRINQAEIDTALKNDLPEITDTIQTAQVKLSNLRSQLSLWETQLLRASGPNAGNTTSGGSSNDPLGLGI